MSSWSKLPAEILNIIFLYLNNNEESNTRKNDVSQCTLTCSNWKVTAQTVLFSDVDIQAQEISNSLNRLILVNNSLGKLVKSFNTAGTLDGSTSNINLLAIDIQFPNLEQFNFYGGDDDLYSCFTKMVIENGLFKNLRSIPVRADNSIVEYMLYVQCVNFLKDSLTTINLFYNVLEEKFYFKFDGLRENPNQFPNLKNIVIHTINDFNNNIYSQQFMDEIGSMVEYKLNSLQQLLITSSILNR